MPMQSQRNRCKNTQYLYLPFALQYNFAAGSIGLGSTWTTFSSHIWSSLRLALLSDMASAITCLVDGTRDGGRRLRIVVLDYKVFARIRHPTPQV